MARILIICDIDGVLIPFPTPDGAIPETHREHWAEFTGKPDPVRIWLNPGHGPLLIGLIERTGAEPAWCSTWRYDCAPQIGARLGLPVWPSVELPTPPTDSSHQAGHLWKQPHVADHAGESVLIWIDDDFTALDHRWAAERTAAGSPTLLVEPDPYIGLQPAHVESIITFVATLGGAQRVAEGNAAQVA